MKKGVGDGGMRGVRYSRRAQGLGVSLQNNFRHRLREVGLME